MSKKRDYKSLFVQGKTDEDVIKELNIQGHDKYAVKSSYRTYLNSKNQSNLVKTEANDTKNTENTEDLKAESTNNNTNNNTDILNILKPTAKEETKEEADIIKNLYSKQNVKEAETFSSLDDFMNDEEKQAINSDNKQNTDSNNTNTNINTNVKTGRIKIEGLVNVIPESINSAVFIPLGVPYTDEEKQAINEDTAILLQNRLNLNVKDYDIWNVAISYVSPFLKRIPTFFKIAKEQLSFKKEKELAQTGKIKEVEVINELKDIKNNTETQENKILKKDDAETQEQIIERLKNKDPEMLKRLAEINAQI